MLKFGCIRVGYKQGAYGKSFPGTVYTYKKEIVVIVIEHRNVKEDTW